MGEGRTLGRWMRAYIDGYDVSGDTRQIGPLGHLQEIEEMEGLDWAVKGGLPSQTTISLGQLNAIFNTDGSTKLHDVFRSAGGGNHVVMVPIGSLAAPAQGNPAFCVVVNDLGYTGAVGANSLVMTMTFGGKPASTEMKYSLPWGVLLAAKAARTAVNTATGVDGLAASAYGGFLCYQVFAGDGTAEIKIEEADTNESASFGDLTGATSGSIDCATPQAGIIQLDTDAAIKRYLRWQVELGTATSVTFALAFIRAQAHNL